MSSFSGTDPSRHSWGQLGIRLVAASLFALFGVCPVFAIQPIQIEAEGDVHWWDGFGSLGVDYHVWTLGTYNDELVAGGLFEHVAGAPIHAIARWNGKTWNGLGMGLSYEDRPGLEYVPWAAALTIYDGKLIAGGNFIKADGRPAPYIAAWNGSSWNGLGGGMNHHVVALTVYNGDLIAGGDFTTAGGQPANRIARWNGSSWSPLGPGFDDGDVDDLTTFQGFLIASGVFTHSGATPVNGLARWDGAGWTGMGSVFYAPDIRALAVYDSQLVVGGDLNLRDSGERVALLAWDGSQWSHVGANLTGGVAAIGSYNGALAVGGTGLRISGTLCNSIALWDHVSWQPLGSGLNDTARALQEHDGSLFVGGWFTSAGGKPSNYIARWDTRLTPVDVQELSARVVSGGVELRWRLSREAAADLRAVQVQRATTPPGPYVDLLTSPLAPGVDMTFFDANIDLVRDYWYRLALVTQDGEIHVVGPIGISVLPPDDGAVRLSASIVPGDDRPVEIHYGLGRLAAPVELGIFDVTGRLVRSLTAGSALGEHVTLWDRQGASGMPVARGMYVIRLASGRAQATRKLLLVGH